MERHLLFFLSLLLVKFSIAQSRISDSLQYILKTEVHDSTRIKTLNALSWELINTGNYPLALQYSQEAIELISQDQKAGTSSLWLQTALAKSYNNIGSIEYAKGNYDKAIDSYSKSLNIKQQIGDKKGMAMSLNNIGLVHMEKGDYDKAIEFYFQSLKIREETSDKKGMASSYNNIGEIHRNKNDYDKALEYYLKSLDIRQEIGDKKGMAYSYNNIGNIYENKSDYDNAISYYSKCLQILEEMGDRQGLAQSYNNIGNIYGIKGETNRAIEYFSRGLRIREDIGDKKGIAQSYNNIGKLYLSQGKTAEAKESLLKSLTISGELKAKPEMKNAYLLLSKCDSALGNYKDAYEYHKSYSAIKDSIFNAESNKVMTQLQASYESEKKDKELLAKDAEIQKQQSESRQKSLQRNALIIGLLLSLILFVLVLRSLAVNKKKNLIILKQKEIVEEKQKNITDSIKYAKRIQEAILPPDKHVGSILSDYFILYKPKDIVSGDFYWVNKSSDDEDILIAAVDCTGHGVPGAFMSIVGYNLLNQAVREHKKTKPSDILDEVNSGVSATLRQTFEESTVRDGMDIALYSLSLKNNLLQFAGANNPLWLVRDNKIVEIKGNKFPIGIFVGEALNKFTNHEISLQKGDTIYTFSDGYADQFGGVKGKKYKYSNLKGLLLSIQHKSMQEQKEILNETFEAWKGNLEQVDDVCVIGVRV